MFLGKHRHLKKHCLAVNTVHNKITGQNLALIVLQYNLPLPSHSFRSLLSRILGKNGHQRTLPPLSDSKIGVFMVRAASQYMSNTQLLCALEMHHGGNTFHWSPPVEIQPASLLVAHIFAVQKGKVSCSR